MTTQQQTEASMPFRYLLRIGFYTAMLSSCPPASGHEAARNAWQPLGDGKVSSIPQKGQIFACDTEFPGGGGAHRVGEWVKDGAWNRSFKPVVEGEVLWPGTTLTITVEGDKRVIRANQLPKHRTGIFPIDPDSAAYQFDRNPNVITEQDVRLTLPAEPEIAATPSCVPMGMIGFTVSGVAIFNAFDLGGRDAPAYEIQDKCNGHPERNGQYHYHDWSSCIENDRSDAPVGYMLDGVPILPPTDKAGREWTSADLDECHGMTGPVMIDGAVKQLYHYRFTRDFPYTIGCFRGTPIKP
jgi:hypothetical protein